MTKPEIHVYLAGPDVFFPDAIEIGRSKVEYLATLGMIGHFPLDNSLKLPSDPKEASYLIANANEQTMLECAREDRIGVILANMNPFHGPSMDVGTAFEVGFSAALSHNKNMILVGYSSDERLFEDRVIDQIYQGNVTRKDGMIFGSDGNMIEAFGGEDNLMMTGAIRRTGGKICKTFEKAAQFAKELAEQRINDIYSKQSFISRNQNGPKIAVVGSSIMDLITVTENFPVAGETVFGKNFDLGYGGKGANQAVAASKCGANVSMISCVGDDLFGPGTINNFKDLGIDASNVHVIKNGSTGAAEILVDSGSGQNRIIVTIGANDNISADVVEKAASVIKDSDCLIMQCEMPLEAVYKAAQIARENNVPAILNVAPAQKVDFQKLNGLEYLVVNETEAEAVSGLKVNNVDDAKKCAKEILLGSEIKNVIVTMGDKGVLLVNRRSTEFVNAFPMQVIDTTGAGDSWLGSFATFLYKGDKPALAAEKANLYAGLSTQKIGTQKSYPSYEEFQERWNELNNIKGRKFG